MLQEAYQVDVVLRISRLFARACVLWLSDVSVASGFVSCCLHRCHSGVCRPEPCTLHPTDKIELRYIKHVYNWFDQDKDGLISAKDLRHMLPNDPNDPQQAVDEGYATSVALLIDPKGGGQSISRKAFAAAMVQGS